MLFETSQILMLVGGAWLVLPLPALGFVLPRLVLFSGAALVGALRGQVWSWLRSWPGRLFLLYALVLVLSPLWSIAPTLSIVGTPPRFDGLLTHVVLLLLAIVTPTRVLLPTIVIASAGVVFEGLLQLLSLDPLANYFESERFLGRVFSFLGEPNALGQFLLLTIPFVFLVASCVHGLVRQALLFLAFLHIIVLFGTASRAALLGLLVMGVLLLLLRPGTTAKLNRNMPRWIVGVSLLVLAFLAWQFFSTRFAVPTEPGRSVGARTVIAQGALEMIRARPIGYGLETMGIASPPFMDPKLLAFESLTTGVDRAHSKPLDLLVTLGPLGLITYYTFFLSLLVSAWKRFRVTQESLLLVGILSLVGYHVSLLFGFETLVPSAFAWMIAGSLLLETRTTFSGERSADMRLKGHVTLRSPERSEGRLEGLLVALSLLVLFTSLFWVRARFTMNRAERLFDTGNLAEAARTYARAQDQFVFDRGLLVRSTEAALLGFERAADDASRTKLAAFVDKQLTSLERLTGGQDGIVPLLRAWSAALHNDRVRADEELAQGTARAHHVIALRIARHVYELLGDSERKEQIDAELRELLPREAFDPSSLRGRILLKEHPWLRELR